MGWKTTEYFDVERPIKHPEVSAAQAFTVAEHFEHEVLQEDGRIRRWAYVEELGKYVRVVIEPDGTTLHNAFIDSRYQPR